MRRRNHVLTLLALAALIGATGCLSETTLTINADGTCTIRADYRASRADAERLLAAFHRKQDDAKLLRDMTDAELATAIRERLSGSAAGLLLGKAKVEALEVKDGKARLAIQLSVSSLQELVTRAGRFGPLLPTAHRMVVAKDVRGHLRLEIHAPREDKDSIAKGVERVAPKGMKLTHRFVLPGKVLTSTLPKTEGKTTWIAMDLTGPDKGAKQLVAFQAKPIVITAELGGLKLAERLDTTARPATRVAQRHGGGALPVVEAAEGFVVSPVSVTTVSYGLLRGEDAFANKHSKTFHNSMGVTVHCEMLLPKGHTLMSSENANVLEAVDDKGADIPLDPQNEHMRRHYSRDDQAKDRTFFDLRIPLPAQGVKALKRLDGEAVVTTNSKWRTLTIADAKADPKKKIDMGEALPDAVITIRTMAKGSVNVQIKGKKGGNLIDHFQYGLNFGGGREYALKRQGHSMSSGNNSFDATLTLGNDELRRGEAAPAGAPTLILRVPDNVHRQKVSFTLHNVPLREPEAGGAEF